jgi:hypothetical protein
VLRCLWQPHSPQLQFYTRHARIPH